MKIRIRKGSLSWPSLLLFLYFVLFIAHNVFYGNLIINILWYIVLGSCFLMGVLWSNLSFTRDIYIYFILFIIATILNVMFVGNASLFDIIFSLIYLGIYNLLCDKRIKQKYIENAIYLCCIILSISLISVGVGNSVFYNTSVNFVSVYLFIPMIVYYVRAESLEDRIPIMPALAVTVTCILAIGRSGIITSAFFLLIVIIYNTVIDKPDNNVAVRRLIRVSIFVLILAFAAYFVLHSDKIQTNVYLQRFTKYGLYGTGRKSIIDEYMNVIQKDIKNLIFGVKFSDLSLMDYYRNNLHNSFLNIHACYGIFLLGYIIILTLSNIKMCIANKRWIYLSLMIMLYVRSCTDIVFNAGSASTSVLFFLLWFIRKSETLQTAKYKDKTNIADSSVRLTIEKTY